LVEGGVREEAKRFEDWSVEEGVKRGMHRGGNRVLG
jgi:hypothetical protein